MKIYYSRAQTIDTQWRLHPNTTKDFWPKLATAPVAAKFWFLFSSTLLVHFVNILVKVQILWEGNKIWKTSYFLYWSVTSKQTTKWGDLSGAYHLYHLNYIYSCTGWMLLPKRYHFISFSINIFVVVAESQIIGKIISFRYRNNQVGYM